ncbi:hypothetical protein ACGFIF_06665 [Kribbella sp. NPDC049174]|uniref:hypothetical protein n=1 Tax=Kribbella sp. NPDC049174 TaxID=3364112 RepID=UPI00371DDDDB
MTDHLKTPDPLPDTIRAGARESSAAWWWIVALALGALWIRFGMFVLSYKGGRSGNAGDTGRSVGHQPRVTEIFAGFTLRQVGKQADRLVA